MNSDENKETQAINADDQNTLAGAGVDLSGGSSENIAEGEKTPEEEVVPEMVDMDSPAVTNTADVGIKFVSEEKTPDKTDLSTLAEVKSKTNVDSSALEREFNSELGDSKSNLKSESEVMGKTSSLGALLKKIQEKLGLKKASVKEELGGLKKMKDSITKDIEEIKDLENSEKKIQEEIGKIESIKKEVEDIEEDLEGKLK